MAEEVEDPATEKRTDDAHDEIADDSARALARNEHLRECTRDKSYDYPTKYCHENPLSTTFPLERKSKRRSKRLV
jgi:hypothetical protein